MWIDGSLDTEKLQKQEGQQGSIGAEGNNIKVSRGKENTAGKYKGSKAWKRLVQEMGKRKPLNDSNEVIGMDVDAGKRKYVDREGECKDDGTSGKKKCRKLDLEGQGNELVKVGEPNLNGALQCP